MKSGQWRMVDLPRIKDPRGNLSFAESSNQVPFDIQRVFYLYDVPAGESRGGHALRDCEQFLIAMSGSFDVILDDGKSKTKVTLNRPFQGLYLAPLIWRELENFASGSVCVVLASEKYREGAYYRDYSEFLAAVRPTV
jgi:hypothetical protein